jgi:hypothetical protein
MIHHFIMIKNSFSRMKKKKIEKLFLLVNIFFLNYYNKKIFILNLI